LCGVKTTLHTPSLHHDLAERHGTPLYVYDAPTIRRQIARLAAFDRVRYAQKACNNLSLLRLMRASGCHVDAVSAGEVLRARQAGFDDSEIEYTADLFDQQALETLQDSRISINVGSTDMLSQVAELGRSQVTLRINPGFGHGHGKKVTTGGPESKHGIWHQDLEATIGLARRHGLEVAGLHLHIGSGSNVEQLLRGRVVLQDAARLVGQTLEKISTGGGLPIPYRDVSDGKSGEIDTEAYFAGWNETRRAIEKELGHEILLETEPGRFLVAQAGYLLTRVCGTKTSGDVDYVLVDAGFNNLLRPAMYGSYHEISAVPANSQSSPATDAAAWRAVVVAGPLCESGDVLTQGPGAVLDPRRLPELERGDLLYVHDAGAYASSMAMNYNSKPLAAEVLISGDQETLIRRRQPLAELWRYEQV
jgi:diaminopimelate decarboxylase